MDDDTLTRPGKRLPSPSEIASRTRPHWPEPFSLPEIGREGEPEQDMPEADSQPPPKKSDPLPKPGDRYRAHPRFLNRLSANTRLIHFVLGDFTCEGFAYSDLRRLRWLTANDPGSGPVLVLRFMEAEITDVRVEGRKLEDIHYYISEGTLPWVWEQPAGFRLRDDNAAVITRITISKAERG